MVSEHADDILQKYFPILKVLSSQTVDIIALYNVFFERLNVSFLNVYAIIKLFKHAIICDKMSDDNISSIYVPFIKFNLRN